MSKTAKKNVKSYKPVARLPVAKFYYQGNHTHPVRRTVLIIEDTKEQFVGYELREGRITRSLAEAGKFIKSYRKDRIAKWGDYSRLLRTAKSLKKSPNQSTLERFPIVNMPTE
jgi:hypothetical protein